jgi:hypothetical protein
VVTTTTCSEKHEISSMPLMHVSGRFVRECGSDDQVEGELVRLIKRTAVPTGFVYVWTSGYSCHGVRLCAELFGDPGIIFGFQVPALRTISDHLALGRVLTNAGGFRLR